jgi:hypothetical protein
MYICDMKKLTIILFFFPFVAFSQTVTISNVKSEVTKVVSTVVKSQIVTNNSEDVLDEEYIERPFRGEEDKTIYTNTSEMTDQELFNHKLNNKKDPKRQ